MVVPKKIDKRFNKKLTHEEYIKALENKPNNTIYPLEPYKGTKIKILHGCKKCGYDKWIVKPEKLLTKRRTSSGCPMCNKYNGGQLIRISLLDKNPELKDNLVNIEDGYKYSYTSRKKTLLKCHYCGTITEKIIAKVSTFGFLCPVCSDGISLPEKFLANFLMINNIQFKKEYKFSWSDNKIYDFYINNNIIIETHGLQHYYNGKSFKRNTGEMISQNDQYKKDLALNNGIKYYIELDCRESSLEWIRNSIINSDISKILNINLYNFDWNECFKRSLKSKVIEAINLYNQNLTFKEISEKLKIFEGTIKRYIKKGSEIGLCNYIPKITAKIPIYSITDNLHFNSIRETSEYYDCAENAITKCCKKIWKHTKSKKFNKNIEFKYADNKI